MSLVLVCAESEWFALRLKSFAEQRAGRYLDRDVRIEDLSVDVIPLSVEATGVVIEGAAETPFAEVERIQVDVQIGSWVRPGITLQRLLVDTPRIRVSVDEAGRHDAPRRVRRRPAGAPRRVEVAIGTVEVVNGTLETEFRRYPVEISARNLKANLSGGGRLELAGHARADEVSVLLPEARPYLGTVSARGSYRPGRVEVSDGSFEAPDIRAHVRGSWEWRERKHARFAIEASGRGRLLDQLGYGDGLITGPFEFAGEFVRVEREWSLSGGLSSRRAIVAERRLQDVRGRLLVDSEGARYRIEAARYAGGELGGTVRMELSSETSPVELELRLAGAAVDQILRDQTIPIAGLSASATGDFSYQFPRNDVRVGSGWANFEIRAGPPSEGLPVAGSASFNIGSGLLETDAVRLLGTQHLMLASGTYHLRTSEGRFDVEATTDAVAELLGLLPLPAGESLWRPSRGSGSVNASVELSGDEVDVDVDMALEKVEAPGYSAERLQGRMAIDRLGAHDIRVELLRPSAGMIVTGSVPLSEPAAEGRELALSIDSEGWPLTDLGPWLPFELPLSGTFSGGASIGGSVESPSGTARGRVSSPRFEGLTASRLDFDIDFSAEAAIVHEAELGVGQGAARLRGRLDRTTDRLALTFDSDRLEIAELGVLPWASKRLSGTIDIAGTIGGSSVRPELELGLGIEHLADDGRLLGTTGAGALELSWNGSRLRSQGGLYGLVSFSGGGGLERQRADLSFDVTLDDLSSVLGLFSPNELPLFDAIGHGRLSVEGAFSRGKLPAARLELERVLVEHRGAGPPPDSIKRLENLEPVTLALDGDSLVIESVYLGTPNEDSEFFVAGNLDLGGSRALELNLQSSLAASWFEPWLPVGVELSQGRFDVIGSIGGTLTQPSLDGVGELSGGRVVLTEFPAVFEEAEARVLLYPGEIVVDRLWSRVAGGTLEGAGTVRDLAADVPEYRFQISGDGLRLRYPEGWSVRTDTDLTLVSSPGGRQLSGELRLDRALYVTDVPIELDQLLRTFFEQRRLEAGETDELLSTTQLNLAIAADKTLRIRNNLADLRGSADLVLRGSLAKPVVFGSVELDSSGRLVYAGNEYELERGQLTFANPYRLEPVIDLVAHTDLREYDVTLSLSGTPDRLNFDFISDPPLAELEVMALLTGGSRSGDPEFDPTPTSTGPESENLGAEGFLYGQATSLVASRFNRLFGLDQFRIDPLTSSTGSLSSARITVGKQLSRDLFVTYSYDPAETEEQIFELEWSVSRSVILVLTQNGDGTYAVDAKWEKAF
ncbi:MAG: translocation/assembly module TamB domain-containing protein [Thermoanaerobaculia bacterium]